jgi:hypothetical protein
LASDPDPWVESDRLREERDRLRAENVVLQRELYRMQEFVKTQISAPSRYWYMNGGVIKQSGSNLQRQVPRAQH